MSEETSPELSRGKRLLFRLAALAIATAIALALVEVGLRIVGYSSPQFYEADETLGYRLIPGMTGRYTREGESRVEINSDGFRDVEHTIEKPADTFRIAVIGDSYVEALQVGRDEMFTNFIPGPASNCPEVGGKKIEVLNFGVSGYSTTQELLMLRSKVWKYSPDLVILLVTTNNDVTDNARVFKQSPIPYFVVRNGDLSLDDSFQTDLVFVRRNSTFNRFGTWLMNHLRFTQAFSDAYRSVKYRWNEAGPSGNETSDAPVAPTTVADVGIDNQIYREPADDNWRSAWDVTERLIAEMARETRERHARFVVVLASNGIQVVPNRELREQFETRIGVKDLTYPNTRLTRYCSANGIAALDLVPDLAAYAETTGTYLHGFGADIGNGHWNQAGHKAAGEIIGRRLCELLK